MKNQEKFASAFLGELKKIAQTADDIAKGETRVKRPLLRRKAEGEAQSPAA